MAQHRASLAEHWDPPRIKAELQRKGLTLNGLSIAHGADRCTASKAIRASYPRFERIIAEALGVEPQEIWPERYDGEGNSLHTRGRTNSTTPTSAHTIRHARGKSL